MTDNAASLVDPNDPARFTGAAPADDGPSQDDIVRALKTVFDPEIPVDIYELGLIYDVEIENRHAHIKMTLTAPGCPVAGTMPRMVELAMMTVEGVDDAEAELVWDPPWTPARMSEVARLELGMD
ncbi:MAG: SUF system Fe-S cluster assembly protein [Alphaproteobacteria bacterium]|jgi:FeS assembly SUF system protein